MIKSMSQASFCVLKEIYEIKTKRNLIKAPGYMK